MIKYNIAFDINGNDNGSEQAIIAALKFAKLNPEIKITLIGQIDNINLYDFPNNVEYILNNVVPSDPKNIKQTLRENTSMNQAIDMLNNQKADSVLSSGDSGSYIAALTLKSKRIDGVMRPAFMPVANAINGQKFVFMDVGANLEVKSEWLVQWASLGSQFVKTMFNKDKPSVALLNIGTEDYKGLLFAREANTMLKDKKDINYLGFHETRDLFRGNFDVGIIDGYGGNLVLKSYEGAVFTFVDTLKDSINKSFKYKLGGLLMKGAFKDVLKKLDYRNVGCAWVIGVNALALKAHGSSDWKSYFSALNQLKDAMEKDLLAKLKKVSYE